MGAYGHAYIWLHAFARPGHSHVHANVCVGACNFVFTSLVRAVLRSCVRVGIRACVRVCVQAWVRPSMRACVRLTRALVGKGRIIGHSGGSLVVRL